LPCASVVADEIVEDHCVEQLCQVDHGRARHVAQQPEALLERRTAFDLIFQFGDDAERLAEILLMEPFERQCAVGGLAVMCINRNSCPLVTIISKYMYLPDIPGNALLGMQHDVISPTTEINIQRPF